MSESAQGPGHLVVQKSLAGMPVFIEGSVTHLRIVGPDGAVIVDGLRPVETLDRPLLDQALPAGSYELTAVERPCEGNCSMLDAPADSTRCVFEVHVTAGRKTEVAILLGGSAGAVVSDCSETVGA